MTFAATAVVVVFAIFMYDRMKFSRGYDVVTAVEV